MQQHHTNHFTFAHYRFHVTPREPLQLPPFNKGDNILTHPGILANVVL